MEQRKGTIILTEGRSGSSWISGLLKDTGVLGKPNEWVVANNLGVSPRKISGQEYLEKIITAASTENGFFSFKIFPHHLHWFQMKYGFDLLLEISQQHDVAFANLYREDRVKQAISFSIALQTKSWSYQEQTQNKAVYNFEHIARCYFMIGRSNEFWKDYITLRGFECASFTYEALMPTGTDFVRFAANHAGIEDVEVPESKMRIQRNSRTEDWKSQFLEDIRTAEFLPETTPSRPHKVNLSNTFRYFAKKQMKPVPFGF